MLNLEVNFLILRTLGHVCGRIDLVNSKHDFVPNTDVK